MRTRLFLALALALIAAIALIAVAAGVQNTLTAQEQLGKNLFFDTNLSDPPGQACAACHAPEVGYTGPSEEINAGGAVYEGAVPGRFGNRKPPAAAYAGDSPILYWDGAKWVGGMFWDGRAAGYTLGDPLAEQALGPFLNPLEQNNASAQVVIDKVLASSYANLFLQVCTDPAIYYECIGRAIAAYERSSEVNPYTSKYDYYLQGKAKLTGLEMRGMELFNGKAQCANCHPGPLFTDYSYDNLGSPSNLANPFYQEPAWNPLGEDWVDLGLGAYLKAAG
jgi:cytochrome c peroxidase